VARTPKYISTYSKSQLWKIWEIIPNLNILIWAKRSIRLTFHLLLIRKLRLREVFQNRSQAALTLNSSLLL